MTNSVIRAMNHDRLLVVDGGLTQVAPDLMFCGTDDLYSLKQRIIVYPPGPQYRSFTGYRVTHPTKTVDVLSPGTSDAVKAFHDDRLALDNEIGGVVAGLLAGNGEDGLSGFFARAESRHKARGAVPEVPLINESRVLPAGSLLLCATKDDGTDVWYSLTPAEEKREQLFRTNVKGQIIPDTLDIASQGRRIKYWPQDDATTQAHKRDLETLRHIAQPVAWKRMLGL